MIYMLEATYAHRIRILSDKKSMLLVRQLQQAGGITKNIVISKVPHEIRDLHHTGETKGKVKERCK